MYPNSVKARGSNDKPEVQILSFLSSTTGDVIRLCTEQEAKTTILNK